MFTKSISTYKGMTFHALKDADHEELSAATYLRHAPKGGIAFARKMRSAQNPQKSSARAAVFVHYRDRIWPGHLRMFTLPGLKWSFERMLTKARAWTPTATTELYAVESDAAIFRASLHWIPGHSKGLQCVGKDVVKTPLVRWYECTTAEEFISRNSIRELDAAWLDFNGILTDAKIQAIQTLWRGSIRHSLTVTSMVARMAQATEERISALLLEVLGDSELVYSRRYVETVPMHQIMLRRAGVKP